MKLQVFMLAVVCFAAVAASAQDAPAQPQATPPQPAKAPKPKSRMNLLRQMQIDLDTASPHARVDDRGRKQLDKCHEVLVDAIAQQQRYKSVNVGKVDGCLKDVNKMLDAGAFADSDRDKLSQDSQRLGESVGKPHRIRLPQPL